MRHWSLELTGEPSACTGLGYRTGEEFPKVVFLVDLYPSQEDSDLLQLLMSVCGEQWVDVDSRLDLGRVFS